jgi:hypothetical protein
MTEFEAALLALLVEIRDALRAMGEAAGAPPQVDRTELSRLRAQRAWRRDDKFDRMPLKVQNALTRAGIGPEEAKTTTDEWLLVHVSGFGRGSLATLREFVPFEDGD